MHGADITGHYASLMAMGVAIDSKAEAKAPALPASLLAYLTPETHLPYLAPHSMPVKTLTR